MLLDLYKQANLHVNPINDYTERNFLMFRGLANCFRLEFDASLVITSLNLLEIFLSFQSVFLACCSVFNVCATMMRTLSRFEEFLYLHKFKSTSFCKCRRNLSALGNEQLFLIIPFLICFSRMLYTKWVEIFLQSMK